MVSSWKKKENRVRKILSQKYGKPLQEVAVSLRGNNKNYKFDLVSPDKSIVGEIKTYVSPTKGGKKPYAKIAHASDACLFLMHAEGAKKRLLVFTDKNFYELYKSERQGKMAELNGIEIKLVPVR